jgi:hypothetical protein
MIPDVAPNVLTCKHAILCTGEHMLLNTMMAECSNYAQPVHFLWLNIEQEL